MGHSVRQWVRLNESTRLDLINTSKIYSIAFHEWGLGGGLTFQFEVPYLFIHNNKFNNFNIGNRCDDDHHIFFNFIIELHQKQIHTGFTLLEISIEVCNRNLYYLNKYI